MRTPLRALGPRALALAVAGCTGATGPMTPLGTVGGKADGTAAEREAQVAAIVDGLAAAPDELAALLERLPKGGDLHSHLAGAVPTARLVEWGAADGLCARIGDGTALAPPCSDAAPPVARAVDDGALRTTLLEAWSMQGQVQRGVLERHQHFFDTFLKFSRVTRTRTAAMLAEVRRNAARSRVSYVELMLSLGSYAGGRAAEEVFAEGDGWGEDTLLVRRDAIATHELVEAALARAVTDLDAWEREASVELGCDTPAPDPGCTVTVRYLVQTIRTQSREHVFGQFAYAYELVDRDPRVVGLNLAQAEEHEASLTHYEDEMRALGVLRAWAEAERPGRPIHVALHAGELVPELLPDDAEGQRHLTFHIRAAAEVARAERIGHAVDLAHEDVDGTLLASLAERGVLVEACLTSNQALLGAEGPDHPIDLYLGAGVPVALATDDEGVLETNLTRENVRAVTVEGLRYPDLKSMARASLTHAFVDEATRADLLEGLEQDLEAFELEVLQ